MRTTRRATATPRTSHPRHTFPGPVDDSPIDAELVAHPLRWWESEALWEGLRNGARAARPLRVPVSLILGVALLSGWAGWFASEVSHKNDGPRVYEIRAVRRVWTPPPR